MVTENQKKAKVFGKFKNGQKKCPKSDFPKESWKNEGLLYNKLAKQLKEPTFVLYVPLKYIFLTYLKNQHSSLFKSL
jgi:hypothetical protein